MKEPGFAGDNYNSMGTAHPTRGFIMEKKKENTAAQEAEKELGAARKNYQKLIVDNRGKPFDEAKTEELKKALTAKRAAVTKLADLHSGKQVADSGQQKADSRKPEAGS